MESISKQVVGSVRKDGTAFKLEDGTWYSGNKKGVSFAYLNRGDVVSFEFNRNGDFKNVQSPRVDVDGSSSGAPTSGGGSRQASPSGFPVAKTHGGRAINRQNALGHAVHSMVQRYTEAAIHKMSREEYVADVIATARLFEAYTTGDIEADAAAKLMEEGAA